jgi:hypothetical protein
MDIPFHHNMDFEDVSYGEMIPSEEMSRRAQRRFGQDEASVDLEVLPNLWLKKQVGFYPLFLAYGTSLEDLMMTGFQNNWRRKIGEHYDKSTRRFVSTLRKAGEYPNSVLFSFTAVPDVVFMDYQNWFLVLNSSHCDYDMSKQDIRMIFRRSWPPSRWKRLSAEHPCNVMAVVPKLDLRKADRIWVRNYATKRKMERMGFRNVEVCRLTLGEDRI